MARPTLPLYSEECVSIHQQLVDTIDLRIIASDCRSEPTPSQARCAARKPHAAPVRSNDSRVEEDRHARATPAPPASRPPWSASGQAPSRLCGSDRGPPGPDSAASNRCMQVQTQRIRDLPRFRRWRTGYRQTRPRGRTNTSCSGSIGAAPAPYTVRRGSTGRRRRRSIAPPQAVGWARAGWPPQAKRSAPAALPAPSSRQYRG